MMNPLSSSGPVIRRVVLRTPNATRLGAFYQELLDLHPQPDPADRRCVSLVQPLSGDVLMTLVEDPAARPAPALAPGLFHVAFLFPELDAWRGVVKRALGLLDGRCGASDHGVSWAVYLTDPDGNGIELAWDKPASEWPWHGDQIRMVTRPLPLRGILLDTHSGTDSPGSFGIGHLHLQVADLDVASIYQDRLGLRVTQSDYPGALFMARDGYHHHFAINTWRTDPLVRRPANAVGLIGWEMMPTEMTPALAAAASEWRDPNGFVVISAPGLTETASPPRV